ncbi:MULTISPECIES: phage major capsid protein [Streptomyces]|uniref:phage major capsid protein n=1 Tax=Streptomyces TaxID=1883 RepID=UPI001B38BB9D|nr:phage major capsid protein [Streptomyces sp. RK75]MBQ0863379.1 phage major capsid protein [Streptomyces sp. RK75]
MAGFTYDEMRSRLEEIHDRAGNRPLDEDEQREWDQLVTLARAVENNYFDRPIGNDRRHRYGHGLRDTTMRNIEHAMQDSTAELDADSAERIERMLKPVAAGDPEPFANRFLAASSDPAYLGAFMKGLSGERGHLLWTAGEAEAYRRVEQVRSELRAMSAGTTTTGGFQIPTVIDPAIRISSDGSISPLRQLAEVRQEVGHVFRPVTSAHVTNEWTAEHAEMSDGTPTLASPSITAMKSTSFVPFSFEYQSAAFGGAVQELTMLLQDGLDQLTAEAFLNGNGTTQPQGLWTGLNGTASELSPAVAETFNTADDVYATQNQLPPRFQPNAVWLAGLPTINKLSEAETTNGAPRYPHVGDQSPVLLRKRLYEYSNMRGVSDIDTAVTADNPVLIYGDIRQTYCIVDFAGSSVELVPHLFGDNNRPTGERGVILWARTGAGVVIANAARAMNVATAA